MTQLNNRSQILRIRSLQSQATFNRKIFIKRGLTGSELQMVKDSQETRFRKRTPETV